MTIIVAGSLSTLFANGTVSLLGYSLQEVLKVLGFCALEIGLDVCIFDCAKHIVPVAVWLVIGIEFVWTVGSTLLLAWIGNARS